MDEMIAPDFASASAPSGPVQVGFHGQDGDFRRLVTRGALLELVTFGFYRFWLVTNIRRSLWTSTSIDGDALEYTGRGRELLFGFLFALAILAPLYLAYFLVAIEAERAKAFASLPLFLFFFGFMQFAVYRARRYRLTRTIWRGVRFWMTGSGVGYAFRAFAWWLLVSVTLGLAYPWQEAAFERYKMGHTYYGDLPGWFQGRGWTFFKRAGWLWLLGVFLVVGAAAGIAKIVQAGGELPLARLPTQTIALIVGLVFIVLISIFGFLYPIFKAIEWRWWVQGLRFGALRFDSNLSLGALIANYWKLYGVSLLVFAVWSVLVLGFVFLGVAVAMATRHPDLIARYAGKGEALPVVATLACYLLLVLALGVVQRIYLVQRVWKLVVSSITLHRLDAADHVGAEGEAASALGEGLVDGLDFAGF
ncbi:DUF898 family protein [Methylocapsa acidiphila]|uniref:DUF898 family protein n=1 Tax=Methylocapsa acidiphila TaxID=133552 RepID=UPI0004137B8C|nr:DUF898 family protein [Methylocapsa acidiphila]